jgi:GTPase
MNSGVLPLIALVGRPNVGKSTLFNILTRSRAALVADEPGLTRDRQYGRCSILGAACLLVDTGGLSSTRTQDALAQLMAEQSWQAVIEAALVLFVVDARVGLLSEDIELVRQLRKANRPILLVVNKIDGLKNMDSTLADFHRLGLSHIELISAAHHRGVSTLQETIHALLIKDQPVQPLESAVCAGIKLAIVGRPNVGKSTLVNRILGEERVVVFDMPGTTRDSVFIPFERRGRHYTVIDTAGVRRRSKVDNAIEKFSVVKTLQAIDAADLVVMVFDAQRGIADQDLHVLGMVLQAWKSLILVVNKWDGLSEEQKRQVKNMLDFKLNFVDYAKILYISALHGTAVGDIFSEAEKIYAASHQKVGTAQMTRLLEAAVAKHQPPLVKGRRIKLRYAHVGGHEPFTVVVHGTQANALPKSYQRYLAEFFRQALNLTGSPVRLELKSPNNPYDPR